jgi:hypothetical protein
LGENHHFQCFTGWRWLKESRGSRNHSSFTVFRRRLSSNHQLHDSTESELLIKNEMWPISNNWGIFDFFKCCMLIQNCQFFVFFAFFDCSSFPCLSRFHAFFQFSHFSRLSTFRVLHPFVCFLNYSIFWLFRIGGLFVFSVHSCDLCDLCVCRVCQFFEFFKLFTVCFVSNFWLINSLGGLHRLNLT